MFKRVLIANRGAIACRIIRTLRKLSIRSVAVYSEADRHSMHVSQADEAICIGPSPAAQSYLSTEGILAAARQTSAEAIHPGYGFLSEKPEFAESCERAGLVFIGPTPAQMRAFALKHTAREMAAHLNVPLLPGTGLLHSIPEAEQGASRIGYPLMLKSTAGGGGIGIRLCQGPDDLDAAFEAVQRLGANNFGDSGAFLERFISQARHIEVQIFGDGTGHVIALGERDCSAQRRNQKVIEETPAPAINSETRRRLFESAVRLGEAVSYRSAGTVEFVYDNLTGDFFFLEVNTRLQVEHGVTEEVTGIDLVEWMVLQASGDLAPLHTFTIDPRGHSVEVRLYAEDAGANFQPSSGQLAHVKFPSDVRIETWVEPGTEVTPYYDPMLAKLIVHADDRPQAVTKLRVALRETQLAGIETNLDYLRKVCAGPDFTSGSINTSTLADFQYLRTAVEVIDGGTQTTVQDYPGRLGYWNVGVPPSGPMDSLGFRLANRLVGNPDTVAALEITISGPTLRFGCDTTIALAGTDMRATLDGVPFPRWQAVSASTGSVLKMNTAAGPGMRAYLAVAGGFDVPEYLSSRSTFMLGRFGGHAGRALRAGDVIHLNGSAAAIPPAQLSSAAIPSYTSAWQIGVLYGPHGAPDFFRDEDIAMLFDTDWKVHYHSDRTGVRLIGPKPMWARLDGGEAGLHPSNIHDNAYAIGTLNFTGDMPVILGPDGPSLGGFVCPATIIHAELWKMGQLRPGDTVRFRAVTSAQADQMDVELELAGEDLTTPLPRLPAKAAQPTEPAVIAVHPQTNSEPPVTYRADGDRYLLVEFGDNILDLAVRLRVHALESQLRQLGPLGILDITPGIRSLHIHYNSRVLPRRQLLNALAAAEQALPKDLDITVPSRIVYMPLSWDDPQARLATEKYMTAVRPDAPWCPSNIEFIRRINGLGSVEDVHRVVFDSSYLVLGLGDVYLGAPVATPFDPRHRLVTTKYNPARTWTPENAVGIGGAYLCIYGMEGPGGYQLVGRTLQVWNTFKSTQDFEPGTPWLLRFFDQIRFYPVSAAELLDLRDGFPQGKCHVPIEKTQFRYQEYQAFLHSIQAEAHTSKQRQQQAFAEERARWAAAGQATIIDAAEDDSASLGGGPGIPDGCQAVASPLTASVWNIGVEPGQRVQAGERLIVLEAMKTELVVTAPSDGLIREVVCKQGALVTPGQSLLILETA
jgi:urea carboxylase